MKAYYIIFVFLWSSKVTSACQCPLTGLNETETNKYSIIFRGKISSFILKEDTYSEAVFEVKELYKGNSKQTFKILINNSDPCKLDLRIGEEWIIYANYKQIDNAVLDFCSRSRKFFSNSKEDFFYTTTGVTYDEELRYLQSHLGLHKLLKEDTNKVENRNQLPNKNQFIIILIASLLGVIAFYWFIKKLLK